MRRIVPDVRNFGIYRIRVLLATSGHGETHLPMLFCEEPVYDVERDDQTRHDQHGTPDLRHQVLEPPSADRSDFPDRPSSSKIGVSASRDRR